MPDELPGHPAATSAADGPARLFNRDFVLLWSGQWVSQLGNRAFALAMMYWMMQATGSSSLMGLLMATTTLPAVALAPLGGVIADRFSRLRVLVVSDALSGVALGLLAWTVHRVDDPRQALPVLFPVAFVCGTLLALISPAVGSLIPDLVPKAKLAAANSLNQVAVQLSVLLGQGVGGLLFARFGAPLLLLADALSFFFAAGCEASIRPPRAPAPAASEAPAQRGWRRYRAEMAAGFRYLLHSPGLRELVLAATCMNFLSAPLLVLLPFFVRDRLGRSAEWYGYLLAALSLGTVVGFLAAGVLRPSPAARARLVAAAMLTVAGMIPVIGWLTVPWLALVCAVVLGVATGLVNVYVLTLLQGGAAPEMRGRLMGVLAMVAGGAMPLGMALAGFLGDLARHNVPLVASVAGAFAIVVTLTTVARPSVMAFLAREAPAPS